MANKIEKAIVAFLQAKEQAREAITDFVKSSIKGNEKIVFDDTIQLCDRSEAECIYLNDEDRVVVGSNEVYIMLELLSLDELNDIMQELDVEKYRIIN